MWLPGSPCSRGLVPHDLLSAALPLSHTDIPAGVPSPWSPTLPQGRPSLQSQGREWLSEWAAHRWTCLCLLPAVQSRSLQGRLTGLHVGHGTLCALSPGNRVNISALSVLCRKGPCAVPAGGGGQRGSGLPPARPTTRLSVVFAKRWHLVRVFLLWSHI